MIKTFRISKTSLKPWGLYGPIEAALKTTLQADAVRVVPLSVDHHGEQTDLELWINAAEDDSERHSINAPATTILALAEARQKGGAYSTLAADIPEGVSAMVMAALPDDVEIVKVYGPAILCGPGATDVPNAHPDCLMMALLGMDDSDGSA
jgi:hypothetical protein